jgi:hypothetical protein
MSGRTSALLAFLVGCGLLAFILRSALGGPPTAPRTDDVAGAAKEVPPKTGKDERVDLPEISGVAGNGIVEPADRETKVAGQAPGRIAVVHVKEGDKVEAGAPLLELEAATEKASLAAAEADLAAAEADLTRTLHGLRSARTSTPPTPTPRPPRPAPNCRRAPSSASPSSPRAARRPPTSSTGPAAPPRPRTCPLKQPTPAATPPSPARAART